MRKLKTFIIITLLLRAVLEVFAQSNGNEKIYKINDNQFKDKEISIIKNVPVVIKNGIGTLYDEHAEQNSGNIQVQFKFKDVSKNDFDTLLAFFKSSGGNSLISISNYAELQFNWGTLIAAYFGADKEISVLAKVSN